MRNPRRRFDGQRKGAVAVGCRRREPESPIGAEAMSRIVTATAKWRQGRTYVYAVAGVPDALQWVAQPADG